MSVLRALGARLRALLSGSAEDRELEEELRFHLEAEAQRLERSGISAREARRRAHLSFGGYDRIVEEAREARGCALLENIGRDVRIAVRGLQRTPGFTAIVVLTLAIGVGATTAVFALASSLLLRPIPGVRDSAELIVVQLVDANGTIAGLSHANIADLRAGSPALAGLAGYSTRTMQSATRAGPSEVVATIVDGDYFGVLGVSPQRGRRFNEQELAADAAGDVVMISDRLWRSRFSGATDVVGRTIELNASPYTIIGVAPAGFHGTLRTGATDVWVPVAAYGRMWHRPIDASDRRTSISDELVGRLSAGASAGVAQQQLRSVMRSFVRSHPDANAHLAEYSLDVHEGIGLEVGARAHTTRTLRLLLGVVLVLLVTACANVANLLLSRGVTRRGETAVRSALGASRGRLVQQHVIEGLVLSLIGGAVGILFALLLQRGLEGQQLLDLPAIESIPIDASVITFAFASALLTGVLFTVLPGLLSMRRALAGRLRRLGRASSHAGAELRGALTLLQVATSITLLIGALMLVRTVRNLERVDVGFDATEVMAFGVTPAPQGYGVEEARAFNRRLLAAVSSLPQLQLAALATFPPGAAEGMMSRLSVPGSDRAAVQVATNEVSSSYFETVGIPVLLGRSFTTTEQDLALDAQPGIVLSRTVAERLFGDAGPVGRVVQVAGFTGTTQQVVRGVVDDIRSHPRAGPLPAAYLPIGSSSLSQSHVLVRSTLPLEEAERRIGQVVVNLDPGIPFFVAESLGDSVRRSIAEERLLARVTAVFAALALLLAAIGLYGVVAWSVAQRRREIGIRMALGARAASVVRLVVGQSLRLGITGGIAGIAGGYALSRVLAHRMFGVTPVDPVTYMLALVGFSAVALVASAVPASSAAAVDPVDTLRQE